MPEHFTYFPFDPHLITSAQRRAWHISHISTSLSGVTLEWVHVENLTKNVCMSDNLIISDFSTLKLTLSFKKMWNLLYLGIQKLSHFYMCNCYVKGVMCGWWGGSGPLRWIQRAAYHPWWPLPPPSKSCRPQPEQAVRWAWLVPFDLSNHLKTSTDNEGGDGRGGMDVVYFYWICTFNTIVS